MHPLRMYALIEAGIARVRVAGAGSGMPVIDRMYIAGDGIGLPGHAAARLVAAICLLPPTILMGASLPAHARWVKSTPRGVSWWGLLYGGNTVGRGVRMLAGGILSAARCMTYGGDAGGASPST